MANYTDKTVNVTVFRSDRPISTQGLELPMALIPHNLAQNTVDSFIDTDSIASFGFAVNSSAYQMAAGFFGGDAAPSMMKIGQLNLVDTDITVQGIYAEDTVVSINLNVNGEAKVVSYTVLDTDTTAALIAAGLQAALSAEYDTATDASFPTFTVTDEVITATPAAVDPYSFSIGWGTFEIGKKGIIEPHVVVINNTDDVLVDQIAEIRDEDDDFFFLVAESHKQADIIALAVYAEANDMMYATSTSEVESADSGNDSNIATALSSASYQYTIPTWHEQADTHFPEAAVIGNFAAVSPYQLNSLNLKTMSGISVSNVSLQQRITLTDRNMNYYRTEYGVGTYREGFVCSGAFADTSRFALWLKFAIGEAVFGKLKREADLSRGVPYSDAGARQLEAIVENDVISKGIAGGTIATGYTTNETTGKTIDLNPYISFGTRAQQANTDIATRNWKDAVVEVVYISPIHHVDIKAYVILNREAQ